MKKTRSQYSLLVCITVYCILTPYNQSYAMMTPSGNGTLIHRVPITAPITQNRQHTTTVETKVSEPIILKAAFSAVEQGNLEALKEHFKAWRYTVLPWEYYYHSVAQTLAYAAMFPESKTSSIVQYLLPVVRKENIERPEDLLASSITNKHTAIIQYIKDTFGNKLTAEALDSAIKTGNLNAVQLLLDSGIDPYALSDAHNIPYSLQSALRAFSEKDVQDTTHTRLAILTQLINRLKPEYVPAAFQVNLCQDPHISASLRREIAGLLNAKHIPTRQCMIDPTTIIATYDSSVGIALTDADFPEDERIAILEKPTMLPSKLHQAALEGNYNKARDILLEISQLASHKEPFPLKALRVLNQLDKATDQEYKAAVQSMDGYRMRMIDHLRRLPAIGKAMQQFVNAEGRTAYDVARTIKAPQNLIDLLNPQSQALPLAIQEVLERPFKQNIQRIISELTSTGKQPKANLPPAKNYKVGDIITVNGLTYIVVEQDKNNPLGNCHK